GRRPDLVAARWRVEASSKDIEVAAHGIPARRHLDRLRRRGFAGPVQPVDGHQPDLRHRPGHPPADLRGWQAARHALRETADTVASIRSVDTQITAQREALALAERAYSLSTIRYKAGLGTQLTVLNAESNVLQQRRLATDLQARRLDLQMGLMKALGGGYQEQAEGAGTDAQKPAETRG
ncbi:fusaric acid resistance protein FusA, partial [Cupriavidus basilensis OR16]